MVEEQLAGRGIKDNRILSVMRRVPRHVFVPWCWRGSAYDDRPLPLGPQQTISQPYVMAYMLEYLQPGSDDNVLEIGTGSGYGTALLAELAGAVFSIEIDAKLSRRAARRLEVLGCRNVRLYVGDGYQGWPERLNFSKIILSAACPSLPRRVVAQLAEGGRMVLPFGSLDQHLLLLVKSGEHLVSQELGAVRFVMMQGEGEES